MENPVNVSGTYYAPYITPDQDTIYLASAPSRDGPWTAGAAIWHLTDIGWRGAATALAAPYIYLNPDDGKYDLLYDITDPSANRYIGFASSSTINGTYSDHGSAILSPSGGAAWDALGVGEPSVVKVGSVWIMAYMGYQTTPPSLYEKVGIATSTAINGTWTKAAGNPIPWGSAGRWNAALMADPTIFYENGYYWIWTLGHSTITPSVSIGQEGLFYNATDPAIIADWIEHPSSPILSPTPAAWDSKRCFRGGILIESGIISGTYTGGTDVSVLTTYQGGNFRLVVGL